MGDIQESELNQVYRIGLIFVANFFLFFGLFSIIMQFIFVSKLVSTLGIIPTTLGYYLRGRIARVQKIGADSIQLVVSKKKSVELSKYNIISITKVVRL